MRAPKTGVIAEDGKVHEVRYVGRHQTFAFNPYSDCGGWGSSVGRQGEENRRKYHFSRVFAFLNGREWKFADVIRPLSDSTSSELYRW